MSAWFVQAAGQVWGPYSTGRMEAFVSEGRVGADTRVSQSETGPFLPAARQGPFRGLFGQPEPEPAPAPVEEPAPERPPAHGGVERPLLLAATLKSQRADRFEAAIAGYGPFVKVQPGVWLVRARLGPAALRNALTRRLTAEDKLLVVEASLEQAAWFNVEAEADRALRQLWAAAE